MAAKKYKRMTNREKDERKRIKKNLQEKGIIPPDKPRLNRKKFAKEVCDEWKDYCLVDYAKLNTFMIVLGMMTNSGRYGSVSKEDPPYYKTEKYYGNLFDEEDHIKLRDILKDIKGKFILSYNDCAFIRELYSDFYIEEVERNNNLVKDGDSRYKELIIRNYK